MVDKGVYIAWNTNTLNAVNRYNGVAYNGGVRLIESSDGGNTFTTPVWVTDKLFAPNSGGRFTRRAR